MLALFQLVEVSAKLVPFKVENGTPPEESVKYWEIPGKEQA
jgi:hypothetical protein